jgi:hypothetical protein
MRLELDACPELSPEVANRYQSARGVLCWAVELERIDLTTKDNGDKGLLIFEELS